MNHRFKAAQIVKYKVLVKTKFKKAKSISKNKFKIIEN